MSNDQYIDEDVKESNEEEANSLLRNPRHDRADHFSKSHTRGPKSPVTERRQSAFAIQPPDGLQRKPRTPNRVRFEVEEQIDSESTSHSRTAESEEEEEEEENYISHDTLIGGRSDSSQRAPLLTGIEAPSVTVASTIFDLDAEHLLENSRPKSGMSSAFMNMANSIMYVCYLSNTSGVVKSKDKIWKLIAGLQVDWTIRLIVINSKLSGANSFQATMEHCYGRSGLVAISVGARQTRAVMFHGD
ncbi:MAG: hypothetical protein Q9209_006662 [Squamulea sp. 1 TL-2023]